MFNIIIIGLFSFFCLAIGLKQAGKISNFEDFALSKGSFSSLSISLTIIASFIGGGSLLGSVSKAYSDGFFPFFAYLGFVLQLLLTAYLVSKSINSNDFKDVETVGDIIGKYYGNWAKQLFAALGLFFCMGILSVQIKAMGETFIFLQTFLLKAAYLSVVY